VVVYPVNFAVADIVEFEFASLITDDDKPDLFSHLALNCVFNGE
jgi:hypothetical protein